MIRSLKTKIMTSKYIRNFYEKFDEKEIDFNDIHSLNEYIRWLELNMTHSEPFLKPTQSTECIKSDVVECKHGDTEAVYFKEGDFAYVVCETCRKVVE